MICKMLLHVKEFSAKLKVSSGVDWGGILADLATGSPNKQMYFSLPLSSLSLCSTPSCPSFLLCVSRVQANKVFESIKSEGYVLLETTPPNLVAAYSSLHGWKLKSNRTWNSTELLNTDAKSPPTCCLSGWKRGKLQHQKDPSVGQGAWLCAVLV